MNEREKRFADSDASTKKEKPGSVIAKVRRI